MEKLSAEFLNAVVKGRLEQTCRDADIHKPTTDEFHADGTRCKSPTAPIAVNLFPDFLGSDRDFAGQRPHGRPRRRGKFGLWPPGPLAKRLVCMSHEELKRWILHIALRLKDLSIS